MRSKKIDNFKAWRDEKRLTGVIGGKTPLSKDGDLAELVGMILGDGSIHKYDRTEGLRIVLPTDKPKTIIHYTHLTERVFKKKPSVIKRKSSNCVDIRLYQNNISKRLNIPTGARASLVIKVPSWITKNKGFMIRYLRGLYEAEGCFGVHLPTSTYKFHFSNRNQSLLEIVFVLLQKLGFHPHKTAVSVQISKKDEVYKVVKLLQFRQY